MKARDRKLALLEQLSQEIGPISLPQLLDLLKDEFDFKERSVRRSLNELVEDGLVERSGRKRGTQYKAVKKTGASRTSTISCFSPGSLVVIEKVRRPIYEREPVTYNDIWFDSYEPNVSFYLSNAFRNQLRKAGERSTNQDPAGTYAHQIFNRLLIDLSYNSSRLEGNTYSLLDTERLLLQGSSAEGKLDEEKVMILNHKEAIRYLVDNAARLNISSHTIYTLHYLLADGLIDPKYAGKVRDHTVRIGSSTYIPFEDSKRLQNQLRRITEKASLISEFFEQSLFLLVHISYLQAFADVNKRTARLSANIPLVINNFVPLSFSDVERDDYMSAMIAIYEFQDVSPLIDLYTYSYMRTCASYDSTIKALGFDEIRVRYRQQRRAIIRAIIERKLVGPQMLKFAQNEAKKVIPEIDQKALIEDILEDLDQMDLNRIVGLGITPEQLEAWLSFYRSSQFRPGVTRE